LDKAEREHLEDVVEDLRERVENNVRFQLTQKGLDDEPEDVEEHDEEIQHLVEAIDIEGVDGHTWDEAFEKYVTGVGYTIVNRLAALRCMEVREFVDEEVTVFKENGLTPAAETLVHEEFLLEDEAILEAYHNVCDGLAEEIEILFDRESAYSLVDPDDDTFEELCGMLDEVPDQVWRADDVLGWVYEYYNRPVVESLDAKNTLEPDDVGPANQFYTPHWVVRMLADNSLGKLYLEATGQESATPAAEELSIEERKERLVTPEDAPDVPELCTYLIPDKDDQDAPSFDHPSELRVIDPACGSGHFLLYAFDILERIWWTETGLDRSEIPAKILEHNLYGVDIDLRSCQLSAFNLYLKARTRAEEENGDFEMPNVGIVCADARVAEVEEAVAVLDEITGEGTDVREALDEIIEEFQTTEALGSLLDVQSTLSEEFMDHQTDIMEWGGEGPHTLNGFLRQLREAVDERTSDSFGEQNLRSFLNLLVVLTQDYDVALMNPPYGSRGRMPNDVQKYVKGHYRYTTEYYINFFEVCDRLVKSHGRIGMLVPRSFMFLQSFQDFRNDFIGGRGSFDFLAEFGTEVLDNATVRTAGTVVRSETTGDNQGKFIRLMDVPKERKEFEYLNSLFDSDEEPDVQRLYTCPLDEFSIIPGSPLSYWVPKELRELYSSDYVIGEKGETSKKSSIGTIRQGIASGNDDRFIREFWTASDTDNWVPYATGGEDTWLLPRISKSILWSQNGVEARRRPAGNGLPNQDRYFTSGVTYNRFKEDGRRFGYLHEESIFGGNGPTIFADGKEFELVSFTNSRLFTYLVLAKTPERVWQVGTIAELPWLNQLLDISLDDLARRAIGAVISNRQYEFISPYYNGPVLFDVLGIQDPLPYYDHPHRELRETLDLVAPSDTASPSDSLETIGTEAARRLERLGAEIQSYAEAIDEAVFDCFDVSTDQRKTIMQEIALRTNEDPRERKSHDPEAITTPTDDFPVMVKDLLLHLTLRLVHEDHDGIVPLSAVEDEGDLLSRIESEFKQLFGEHASARLAEVDQVLGSQTADEEAYPNLREWLENDLFDYHVSKFDRTPIIWRLTTERLVSDPEGEGFACLVDYHQLDEGVFDRLQNRYLEPRKALLRERRSAANRRRGDDSLSTSEQADAAEEYARCESGLEQIGVFEDKLTELAQSKPREWPNENREAAAAATDLVAKFRDQTAEQLEALDELAAIENVEMENLFSPSFYETVQKNRGEWLDALDDLEKAFEAYAKDGSEPVEAHLYDLFEYYDDLVGSAHYASNGILFTTYYYDKFDDAGQTTIADNGDTRRAELLATLASDLDEYKATAAEIADACDEIADDIPSNWFDRALSEITTAGYRPNHKHGVVINITPLVEAEIVPEIVNQQVI